MKRIHSSVLCLVTLFCISCVYSSRKYILPWVASSKPDRKNNVNTRVMTTTAIGAKFDGVTSSKPELEKKHGTKCTPKRNTYFMKTHKTGSTTMQNILLRYAWTHNLTVGLPLHNNNFDYANQRKFDRSMVQPVKAGTEINMLMHHMIFSRLGVASILPPDAVYFTFLRDPATQFESVYKYFNTIVIPFKKVKSLKEFVEDPQKYFRSAPRLTFSWFAKNGMTFDLGFDNLNETDANIQRIVKEMDDTFDIVLISEYFDMSLVLLRETLCWTMMDVAYLSVNARKTSTIPRVDHNLSQKIRDWNKIDTHLYNYYNATFWTRVKKYGLNRMNDDLKHLDELKNKLKSSCVEEGLFVNKDIKDPKYKMYNPPGVEMTQYHLRKGVETNETCIQLILPEIPWWKKMTNHQKAGIIRDRES